MPKKAHGKLIETADWMDENGYDSLGEALRHSAALMKTAWETEEKKRMELDKFKPLTFAQVKQGERLVDVIILDRPCTDNTRWTVDLTSGDVIFTTVEALVEVKRVPRVWYNLKDVPEGVVVDDAYGTQLIREEFDYRQDGPFVEVVGND